MVVEEGEERGGTGTDTFHFHVCGFWVVYAVDERHARRAPLNASCIIYDISAASTLGFITGPFITEVMWLAVECYIRAESLNRHNPHHEPHLTLSLTTQSRHSSRFRTCNHGKFQSLNHQDTQPSPKLTTPFPIRRHQVRSPRPAATALARPEARASTPRLAQIHLLGTPRSRRSLFCPFPSFSSR